MYPPSSPCRSGWSDGRVGDEEYLKLALAKARVGAVRGEPFGACVVLGDRVVSCERSATTRLVDATAHAEIVALRKASRRLGTRFLDGSAVYSSCEPCPMCFFACEMARVSKVVFSATLDDLRASGFSKDAYVDAETMKRLSGSRVRLVPSVLRDEGRSVFRLWTRASRLDHARPPRNPIKEKGGRERP